jgi:hypothetical protein
MIEVTAHLYYCCEEKHQTEAELLAWLKQKADLEYEKKGYAIVGFEVESIRLESATTTEKSVGAFFHGHYGRMKQKESLCAKVKLQLVSRTGDNAAMLNTVTTEEKRNRASVPAIAKQLSGSGYSGFLSAKEFKEICSTQFPVSAQTFFQLFYSGDFNFEEEYHKAREDTEIEVGAWVDDPLIGHARDVAYRVKLSGPIGPPTSKAVEKQRYSLESNKLVVEISMHLVEAPYADHFHVETRWVVEENSSSSCILTVSSAVVFSKSTWLEPTITSKTFSEMSESFGLWVKLSNARIRALGTKLGEVSKGGSIAKAADSWISAILAGVRKQKFSILFALNVFACVLAIIAVIYSLSK